VTSYPDLEDLLEVAAAAIVPAEVLVRDFGLLESALARPQASAFGEDAYPDIWTKAAALLESLARNRALIDGNKRLSWVATRYFLAINDHDLAVIPAVEIDAFVRSVAQGEPDLPVIAAWLSTHER
jgi:death-on-curing protein